MMHGRWGMGWVAVGVLAFGQSACTSLFPLELADAEAMLEALETGDRLSVLDSRGTTTELEVTAIGADFIEGRTADDEPVRIAAADLREIHERRAAPGKAIALGAGAAFLLFMQSVTMAGYEWY